MCAVRTGVKSLGLILDRYFTQVLLHGSMIFVSHFFVQKRT